MSGYVGVVVRCTTSEKRGCVWVFGGWVAPELEQTSMGERVAAATPSSTRASAATGASARASEWASPARTAILASNSETLVTSPAMMLLSFAIVCWRDSSVGAGCGWEIGCRGWTRRGVGVFWVGAWRGGCWFRERLRFWYVLRVGQFGEFDGCCWLQLTQVGVVEHVLVSWDLPQFVHKLFGWGHVGATCPKRWHFEQRLSSGIILCVETVIETWLKGSRILFWDRRVFATPGVVTLIRTRP